MPQAGSTYGCHKKLLNVRFEYMSQQLETYTAFKVVAGLQS